MKGDILLVEDHRDIAEMVADYLSSKNYHVDLASDGISGLQLGVTKSYAAVILDLMLPGIDGLEVCRRMRSAGKREVPILMLTARDTLQDKLMGFECGADDYLVKPFDLEELAARLTALIRRGQASGNNEVLTVGDLSYHPQSFKVSRSGQELSLTPIGLRILQILIRESPGVVDRHDIEREVWGAVVPDSDALRSHMYVLRKCIDKPFDKPLIHTVHGAGFRLAADA